jgi:hypothetical protein
MDDTDELLKPMSDAEYEAALEEARNMPAPPPNYLDED